MSIRELQDVKLGMADKARAEKDTLDFTEAAPSAGGVGAMIGTKNLLIAIVTMPFVFLIVVMTIISIFGAPDKDRSAKAPAAISIPASVTLDQPALTGQQAVAPIEASLPASAAIVIPKGASAGAMSLDGDRLAVRIDGESGAMIVIYDLSKGEPVQIIPLTSDATN
jgi:hypothetical protein